MNLTRDPDSDDDEIAIIYYLSMQDHLVLRE